MGELSQFSFPTTILYGPGAVAEVPSLLQELSVSRPLIITDTFMPKTQSFAALTARLEQATVSYSIYDQIHANPYDRDLDGALKLFQVNRCDSIIGIGGGSALDAAKGIAVLAAHGGHIGDYDAQKGGGNRITGPLPPIIAVPTTAGTGSEVGKCAVITSTDTHRKFMVCHPMMLPVRAVLDPELTVSLPPHLTAATGMDALTHSIESLTAPVFHPLCDAIAVKGIELCIENLETAVKEAGNLTARGNMLLAASMGAIAFQKDLGAAHSLSHALSAVCSLHHGLANAICLVPVMKYNLPDAEAAYALIAPFFKINTFDLSKRESAEQAIEQIRLLVARIGITDNLKAAGVREDQLDEIAEKAFLDPCHKTNIRSCTQDDLKDLLQICWEGNS